MALAEQLRRFREKEGLSLDDLAARAQVSKTYLWELERDAAGEKKPSASVLLQIAKALSVTIVDLLELATTQVQDQSMEVARSLTDFQERMEKLGTPLSEHDLRDLASMRFRGGQPRPHRRLKMMIREQVYDAVSDQAARACINQHTRNIHTLYAMPDGRVCWSEESSTNSWDVLAVTVIPVAIIYRTGTGSCGCNCDACVAGDDPVEWAGDDANELLNELIANVAAIEVGYFNDEQEA